MRECRGSTSRRLDSVWKIVGNLTAFAMLVHSVLGCCIHHTHAHDLARGAEHQHTCYSAAHDGGGHCHSEHPSKETSDSNDRSNHSHPTPCNDGSCQFVPTGRMAGKEIGSQANASIVQLAIRQDLLCLVTRHGLSSKGGIRILPPTRIHFLTMSLLL